MVQLVKSESSAVQKTLLGGHRVSGFRRDYGGSEKIWGSNGLV